MPPGGHCAPCPQPVTPLKLMLYNLWWFILWMYHYFLGIHPVFFKLQIDSLLKWHVVISILRFRLGFFNMGSIIKIPKEKAMSWITPSQLVTSGNVVIIALNKMHYTLWCVKRVTLFLCIFSPSVLSKNNASLLRAPATVVCHNFVWVKSNVSKSIPSQMLPIKTMFCVVTIKWRINVSKSIHFWKRNYPYNSFMAA